MTLAIVEVAREALARVGSLADPPWNTRKDWLALRKPLQRRVTYDVEHLLADLWDSFLPGQSKAEHLLWAAASEAGTSDAVRALRSVAPPCLVAAFAPTTSFGTISRTLCAGETLGDAHVHSGGAIPFENALDSLFVVAANGGLPALSGPLVHQDVHGTPVSLPALIAGLVLCGSPRPDGSVRADPWADVHRAAANGDPVLLAGLCAEFSAPVDLSWSQLRVDLQGLRLAPEVKDGLIVALCVLHGAVTTSDMASLGLFVDDFRRFPVYLAEPGRFEAAIRHMTPGLDRLELRKSIAPVAAGDSISLLDLARVFAEKASGSGCTVQMPIGFLKRPMVDERDPFHLDGQMRLAEHIVEAIDVLGPTGRDLIASLDVAGYELAQPNHVYLACYELIRRELDRRGIDPDVVTYSAHAGEAFEHPLGGLRAIDEYASGAGYVTRLGHCLALDDERAANLIASLGAMRPRLDLALSDLCWAHDSLLSTGSAPSASHRSVIRELGWASFPSLDPTVDEVLDWHRRLPLLTTAERYREVPATPSPPGSPTDACHGGTGRVDQMLHAYFHPGCHHGLHFARETWVDPPLALTVQDLRRDLYSELRNVVVAVLGDRVLVETCPTSNARLGRFPSNEHPIKQFVDLGLRCTISSDDPGLFSTTLEDEYAVAQDAGLTSGVRSTVMAESHRHTAAALGGRAAAVYAVARSA